MSPRTPPYFADPCALCAPAPAGSGGTAPVRARDPLHPPVKHFSMVPCSSPNLMSIPGTRQTQAFADGWGSGACYQGAIVFCNETALDVGYALAFSPTAVWGSHMSSRASTHDDLRRLKKSRPRTIVGACSRACGRTSHPKSNVAEPKRRNLFLEYICKIRGPLHVLHMAQFIDQAGVPSDRSTAYPEDRTLEWLLVVGGTMVIDLHL